jgi:hypothetical protein
VSHHRFAFVQRLSATDDRSFPPHLFPQSKSCDFSQQSKAAAPRAEVEKVNRLALMNISP